MTGSDRDTDFPKEAGRLCRLAKTLQNCVNNRLVTSCAFFAEKFSILRRLPLPSGKKVALPVMVYIFIMGAIYCITNSLPSPYPKFVREKGLSCSKLWWPNDEIEWRSFINLTGYFPGNACIYDPKYQDKKNLVQKELTRIQKSLKGNRTFGTGAHEYFTKLLRLPPVEIGQFQPIDFTGGYVLSAFHNHGHEPYPGLRVLYMVPLATPDLYCHTICNGVYTNVKGRDEFLAFFPIAHERCIWNQHVLHCNFGQECNNITHVSVTSDPCIKPTNILPVVKTAAESKPPALIGACLNHIYNMTTKHVPTIINYFETLLYFGADIVYLYGHTGIDANVSDVLQYYVKKGFLKIYNYTIPEDVSSLFYFAQVMQHMDCAFRHSQEAEYLFLTDLDEALYPIHHKSYRALLKEPGIFENTTASVTVQRTSTYLPLTLQHSHTSKTNHSQIQMKDKEENYILCSVPEKKLLIRPQYVLTSAIHYIAWTSPPYQPGAILPRHIVSVFHTKGPEFKCAANLRMAFHETVPMNASLNRNYPHIRQRVEDVYTQVLR